MVMSFAEVCKIVFEECNNPYAKTYAKAGLRMTDPYEVKVQALYILSNLTYWRGARAKEIKAVLTEYTKN